MTNAQLRKALAECKRKLKRSEKLSGLGVDLMNAYFIRIEVEPEEHRPGCQCHTCLAAGKVRRALVDQGAEVSE